MKKAKLKITMPEGATPEQIEKFTNDWKDIVSAFEEVTGEHGSTTMSIKDETGKKKVIWKSKHK